MESMVGSSAEGAESEILAREREASSVIVASFVVNLFLRVVGFLPDLDAGCRVRRNVPLIERDCNVALNAAKCAVRMMTFALPLARSSFQRTNSSG